MTRDFCPGYPDTYHALVATYPDETIYPVTDFRVEWGPIFHRGRLDGSARVLVIGQDPAEEETFARRILIGVAGQRTQGLLARIGIEHSYVMINTFLYSVATSRSGNTHVNDSGIVSYRHAWLDRIAADNTLDAVITLGGLADTAYNNWRATPTGQTCTAHHAALTHPTADSHPNITTAALLADWNAALPGLHSAVTTPDASRALHLYGQTFTPNDLTPIPDRDLPPGLPPWTQDLTPWARRGPGNPKRAVLTITVPTTARTWPTPQQRAQQTTTRPPNPLNPSPPPHP